MPGNLSNPLRDLPVSFISAVTRAFARRGGGYGATIVVRSSIHVMSW
jgi:hypothetical protein